MDFKTWTCKETSKIPYRKESSRIGNLGLERNISRLFFEFFEKLEGKHIFLGEFLHSDYLPECFVEHFHYVS